MLLLTQVRTRWYKLVPVFFEFLSTDNLCNQFKCWSSHGEKCAHIQVVLPSNQVSIFGSQQVMQVSDVITMFITWKTSSYESVPMEVYVLPGHQSNDNKDQTRNLNSKKLGCSWLSTQSSIHMCACVLDYTFYYNAGFFLKSIGLM